MEAVLTEIKALVSDTTTSIDIVFDMYLGRSIKEFERERRGTKKINKCEDQFSETTLTCCYVSVLELQQEQKSFTDVLV